MNNDEKGNKYSNRKSSPYVTRSKRKVSTNSISNLSLVLADEYSFIEEGATSSFQHIPQMEILEIDTSVVELVDKELSPPEKSGDIFDHTESHDSILEITGQKDCDTLSETPESPAETTQENDEITNPLAHCLNSTGQNSQQIEEINPNIVSNANSALDPIGNHTTTLNVDSVVEKKACKSNKCDSESLTENNNTSDINMDGVVDPLGNITLKITNMEDCNDKLRNNTKDDVSVVQEKLNLLISSIVMEDDVVDPLGNTSTTTITTCEDLTSINTEDGEKMSLPTTTTATSDPIKPSENKPTRNTNKPFRYRNNDETNSSLLVQISSKSPTQEANIPEEDEEVECEAFCICNSQWEDGVFYIGCDYCGKWFHGTCMNIPEEAEGIIIFKCPPCLEQNVEITLSEKERLEEENDRNELENSNSEMLRTKLTQQTNISKEIQDRCKDAEKTVKEKEDELKKLHDQLNQKQREIKNLSTKNTKLQTEVSQEQRKVTAKVTEVEALKKAKEELNSNLKAVTNKADLLNKKCTKSGRSLNTLQVEMKAMSKETEELKKTIEKQEETIESHKLTQWNLEKELDTHKRIGKNALVPNQDEEQTKKGKKKKSLEEKEMSKEILSLKDLISNLETIIRDLHDEKKTLREQCDAQLHNLEREAHINNVLMEFRKTQNTTPIIPTKHPEVIAQENEANATNDVHRSTEIDDRLTGNRNPTPALHQNQAQGYDVPPQRSYDYCLSEYRFGYRKCTEANCPKNHNIDFKKLKRGICFNEFYKLGSCRNKESCQYCHQIPEEIRNSIEVKNEIQQKINRSKENRNNYYPDPQNTRRRESHATTNMNTNLGQLQTDHKSSCVDERHNQSFINPPTSAHTQQQSYFQNQAIRENVEQNGWNNSTVISSPQPNNDTPTIDNNRSFHQPNPVQCLIPPPFLAQGAYPHLTWEILRTSPQYTRNM